MDWKALLSQPRLLWPRLRRKARLAFNPDAHATFRLEDGSLFLAERKIGKDWGWLQNRWILIRGTDRREFNFEHRLYSGTELAQLLRDAGFSEVTLHGALDGSPYDQTAQRLVAVARKLVKA